MGRIVLLTSASVCPDCRGTGHAPLVSMRRTGLAWKIEQVAGTAEAVNVGEWIRPESLGVSQSVAFEVEWGDDGMPYLRRATTEGKP
jgi:hypothetical protein